MSEFKPYAARLTVDGKFKHYKIVSKDDYKKVLRYAKSVGSVVHTSHIIENEGIEKLSHLWIIDWDTINNIQDSLEESLECPNCGKKCSSKSGYTLHVKTCCTTTNDHLKCDICGKQMKSNTGLLLHKRQMHGENVQSTS